MANKRIKGITIELDGETKGLDKALSDVNKRSGDLTTELKEVERALKFNPGNLDLLAQQQKILQDQVENSTKKLEQLKSAQSQVEEQFKSGKIGEEQYRAFQREVIKAESQLDGFKKKLASVDDGKSLDNLKQDMREVKKETDKAEGSVGELGAALGGLVAGAGASEVVGQALDFSNLDTQIDISFNVSDESKASVKDAIKDIGTYGIDAEEALEGVRRQWALNADASDESNAKVTKGAAAISKAYAGIDFTELIQETNEISSELNISNEEALGLTNSLLKMGFPPEQLDIIAEYGKQLSDAGYNATEVQAIMQAGVETGTWNIDNLLDGLKEGRILIGEFGSGVDDAMSEILEGTGISSNQLQEWGKAVSAGGEEGKQAMVDVAEALNGVDDATKKNELGVKLFGTLYEDQGQNIIDTLLGAEEQLVSTKEYQDNLNSSIDSLDSSPAVQMKKAFTDIKTALAPLVEQVAGFVSKVAEWVSANPKLTATIIAIASAITIITGVIMLLAPVITALAVAAGALNIAMLPLTGIILGIMAAIAALIAIGVLLWQNWDTIKAKTVEIFSTIGNFFSDFWNNTKVVFTLVITFILNFIRTQFESVKKTIITIFTNISGFFTKVWNGIKSVTSTVWEKIKSSISSVINGIKSTVSTVFGWIGDFIGSVWDGINATTSNIWDGIVGTIKGAINGVISAINGMINGLNKIKIKLPEVPDWVPGLGGKGGQTLGFNIPNIPKLAVGTNYVEKDGLAYLHEGEAVVPKKYNPAAGGINSQPIIIQPAPVYLDDQLLGEIFFNQTDNRMNNQATLQMFMKGERM